MKNFIKTMQCTFIISILICCPRFVTAAPSFAGDADIYMIVEQYLWREFDNGTRLVKESGPRFGIGFTYNFEFLDHHLILKPRVEIIGGQVDYDGHACNINTGVCQPATANTSYFNGKLETDLGWRFRSTERTSIEPFVGIGFQGWLRDIYNGTASDGSSVRGYTENWHTLYLRAGLRANFALGEKTKFFAEAGGKFPVYTANTAYLSDAGLGPDVTVKPGNEASWFAEAGISYKHFKTSFFFDSMNFAKSDVVNSGGLGFFQPKSQAELYGLRIGVTF